MLERISLGTATPEDFKMINSTFIGDNNKALSGFSELLNTCYAYNRNSYCVYNEIKHTFILHILIIIYLKELKKGSGMSIITPIYCSYLHCTCLMPCSNYFQLKGNNKQEKLLGFSSRNYNMYRDIQICQYVFFVYNVRMPMYTLEYLQKYINTIVLYYFFWTLENYI